MARAATTADVFNAVAEPRRREILDFLALGERPVGDVVEKLGIPQPLVSKHLTVLRTVGLVSVRAEGKRRMYQIHGDKLRPIHEWARTFERFWEGQLDRIKERAERAARAAETGKPNK